MSEEAKGYRAANWAWLFGCFQHDFKRATFYNIKKIIS